jgi:PKD repeat protein
MPLLTNGSRFSCCLLLGLLGACLSEDGHIEPTQTTQVAVTADLPPIAAFGVVCIGLTCSADAEASSDDVFIASYSWSWGDSTSTTGGSSASAPSHTYAVPGPYRILLSVFDSIGQVGRTSKLVTAVEGPSPNFTASCATRNCTFDGSSSTGPSPLVGFHWDWDDETTTDATVPTAGHTFGFAATFRVHLRVTDANGRTAGITRDVVVP